MLYANSAMSTSWYLPRGIVECDAIRTFHFLAGFARFTDKVSLCKNCMKNFEVIVESILIIRHVFAYMKVEIVLWNS